MSVELALWGLLPASLSVGMIVLTAWAAAKRRTLAQSGLSLAIVALCLSALWILYRIFVIGAWPTAIPHLLIVLAAALCALQRWMLSKVSHDY